MYVPYFSWVNILVSVLGTCRVWPTRDRHRATCWFPHWFLVRHFDIIKVSISSAKYVLLNILIVKKNIYIPFNLHLKMKFLVCLSLFSFAVSSPLEQVKGINVCIHIASWKMCISIKVLNDLLYKHERMTILICCRLFWKYETTKTNRWLSLCYCVICLSPFVYYTFDIFSVRNR